MSPRRGRKQEGSGNPTPEPDLDALRARIAETLKSTGKPRPAARKRRHVLPDEGADEPAGDDVHDEASAPGRWWEHGDAGRPRPVVGGIAARTRKGPIGATWWSRRFLDSLEAVMVGGRMERGRSYARRGQVVDLRVGPGVVIATVQGSREDPYAVHLRMPVVPGGDWDRVVAALAARAGFAARMLAGELPHEVEQVFDAEGASLFPAPHARLVTECTCPDWENPCKHIAAVCYLLAEQFDRDPFSLLAWRGKGRDDVLHELRALRQQGAGRLGPADEPAAAAPARGGGGSAPPDGDAADGYAADGYAPDGYAPDGDAVDGSVDPTSDVSAGAPDLVDRFWAAGPELAHIRIHPGAAPVPAAVLRLAPRGTINVRGGDLVDVLASAYREMAASAAERAGR